MRFCDLEGRPFLVLGVGPGMGLEIVRALGEAGALVVCADLDPDHAEAAAVLVGGVALVGDVLDPRGVASLLEKAEAAVGPIRGVIDIIGGSIGSRLTEATDALIERNFDLNLKHAFRVLRQAGPLIGAAGGGSITFLGSLAGVVAAKDQAIYGAAKAALHHLVRAAAAELGPLGVRVNAVAPGLVSTPRMLERFSAAQFAEVRAASPLGRVSEPADIARALLFFASDMSRAITGQTLVADTGFSCQPRLFQTEG